MSRHPLTTFLATALVMTALYAFREFWRSEPGLVSMAWLYLAAFGAVSAFDTRSGRP